MEVLRSVEPRVSKLETIRYKGQKLYWLAPGPAGFDRFIQCNIETISCLCTAANRPEMKIEFGRIQQE